MLDQGFTVITAWVEQLSSDSLLAFLIGYTPDSLPPLNFYYDFIDRLRLQGKQFQKSGRKDLFPVDKNKKPAVKPGKGRKLPSRHPGVTLFGNGICIHTHAGLYGHKVINCPDNGENHFSCPRHYSDPDAHWGLGQ